MENYVIIIIIIIPRRCLWCCRDGRSHFESTSGSSGECRLSTRWPRTLRPSQSTWTVSPLVGCCCSRHRHHLLLFLANLSLLCEGAAGRMADSTTLLSICDAVHLVVVKTTRHGDTSLLSSHFLDWRQLLVAADSRCTMNAELMGVGLYELTDMSFYCQFPWLASCHLHDGRQWKSRGI